MRHDELVNKLSGVGKLKLLIVSGAFIQEWDSRVDILVVGDSLKENMINSAMKSKNLILNLKMPPTGSRR